MIRIFVPLKRTKHLPFFILALILLIQVTPAIADPLESIASEVPGADVWWIPPGFSIDDPDQDEHGNFTLTWSDSNVVRYKVDDELRCLLRSKGPLMDFNFSGKQSSIRLKWLLHELDSIVADERFVNQLNGDRQLAEVETSFRIPIANNDNLILAGRFSSFQLQGGGVLPTLVHGIPGLESDEDSSQKWSEDGIMLSIHREGPKSSFGAVYGNTSNHMDLKSISLRENVKLEVAPEGNTFGLTGKLKVGSRKSCEMFYRFTKNSDDGGVFRKEKSIGPLSADMDSWQYGLRLREESNEPRWNLSFSHGTYRTALVGSAKISDFGAPVFGILSPRYHIDSNLRIERSSLIFEHDMGKFAGADLSGLLGATHWDIDGDVVTWESALFGSAILNKTINSLEVESGWFLHAGLTSDWILGQNDKITLRIGQSIPVGITRVREISPLKPPELKHETNWDGGRYLSLSFTHSF